MKALVFLLCFSIGFAAHHVDLQATYPFNAVLLDEGDQYYKLHWNFNRSTETVNFAVNVSTTGWVGLGLSPNGQMPGSDVIMAWVDGDNTYFYDRFAEGRFLPVIDTVSQDWFLINSKEENGFTFLEFSRNYTSCDPQDLDITFSTARIVWSFSNVDPPMPSGEGARRHDYQGSISINLLGGLPGGDGNAPLPSTYLDVQVNNVTLPSNSTTYWCSTYRLPSEIRDTTRYITRISPVITPQPFPYVHHMLVYICRNPLMENEVGQSRACHQLNDNIMNCRQGLLIGAWAIGGEDFVYPENIAYPVGGLGQEQFVLIEIHYDNPSNNEGVIDSSGLRFFYTNEAREHDAGILYLGHYVTPFMTIPPRTANYTIAGICSADCTSSVIPEEGIRIFADVLHTHLAGRAVTIQQFRYNADCGRWVEQEPIDQNLNYDFNYQQITHLPREHLILPGDVLVVKCEYSTAGNGQLVLGGESTNEEMCLSFPVFYPRQPDGSSLVNCGSLPSQTSFNQFVEYLFSVDPTAAATINENNFLQVLSTLNWEGNPQLARNLQDSVLRNPSNAGCLRENGTLTFSRAMLPEPSCPYQAPNPCTTEEPQSCCTTAGATRLETHLGVVAAAFVLVCSIFAGN